MANPNNALGTNGAYGGRTSVNAFNDVLGAFKNRGVLSGWGCVPSSGLTVEIGGNGSVRDVALAEDNVGNKTTVNNISQAPIPVVMPAAPANNSRVDSIVAYIESSPSTNAETDNYSAVNLLVVSGNTGTTPSASSESEIRTAITADGASGSTAYYVVLANVTIPAGTTDIDASMISSGDRAEISFEDLDFGKTFIRGTGGNPPTIQITPEYDCLLIAYGSIVNTWGSGGGSVSADIHINPEPAGQTSIGDWMGLGDNVGRSLHPFAVAVLKANIQYSVTLDTNGAFGNEPTRALICAGIPAKW